MKCPRPDLVVETPRLRLRLPDMADVSAYQAMLSPPEMRQFLGQMSDEAKDALNSMLRHAGSWALFGHGFFIVEERDSGAFVGHCGVFRTGRGYGADFDALPECGWLIGKTSWGRGYAQEAMKAALGWFFAEFGIQPVACMIQAGNDASVKVAAQLGFEPLRTVSREGEADVNLYRREAAPIEDIRL